MPPMEFNNYQNRFENGFYFIFRYFNTATRALPDRNI